jgi:hypothetical protein
VSLFDFLCHHVVSLALKKNMWAYSALHLRSCPTSTLAVFRITFHPKLHSYIPNIQFCLLSLQFLSTSCTSPALSAHCESKHTLIGFQTHGLRLAAQRTHFRRRNSSPNKTHSSGYCERVANQSLKSHVVCTVRALRHIPRVRKKKDSYSFDARV